MSILEKYRIPMFAPEGEAGGSAPAPAESASSAPAEPAVTPTEAPVSPSPTGEEATPQSFDQLGLPDSDEEVIQVEAEAPKVPEAKPKEVKPGSPEAKPSEVKPEAKPTEAKPTETPAPQEQPKPAEAPAEVKPAPAPESPDTLLQQLGQHRDTLIAGLAADRFKLTKEEADGLELDAAGTIPKIMSRVYYEAVQSALLHIQNFVPQMVQNTIKITNAQRDAEAAFYGANKALDKEKHGKDVLAFAQAFRSSNPQMDMATLSTMVAAAVMAKHGIKEASGVPAGNPPVKPQTPPFVPARPGNGIQVTTTEESPWAGLGQSHDE